MGLRWISVVFILALSLWGCSGDGGETGAGGDAGTGGSAGTGGGGGADPTCTPWCNVVDECTTDSFSECVTACEEELAQASSISSACAEAVRDQNRCLGALNCPQFEAWATEVPPDSYPCKAEDDGVVAACL